MIFGEWRQWLNNHSRNTRGRAAGRKMARSARPGLQVLEGREVPAVVYVANPGDYSITTDQGALGLDNGDTVTWNPGTGSAHGGQVDNLTFGTNAFSSIQTAVNAATAGDTVRVGSGTFAETVNVSKQLTLLGNEFGVDARTRTGAPESVVSNPSGAFQISADNVTIDGFTIRDVNSGLSAGVSIASFASGYQVLNNIIRNNQIGIYANSDGAALIKQNLFDANNTAGSAGGAGIYSEVTSGLTVEANEFRNHTLNNPVIFAAISTTSHTNLTFKDNFVHDNVSGVFALGIDGGLFQGNTITGHGTGLTFGGSNTNINVLENTITGNLRGVRIQDFGYFGVAPNSDIEAHSNDFSGNSQYGLGIVGAGYTGTFDAAGNWWGTNTAAGVAAEVSGNVDFMPFLVTGKDTDLFTAGFQGDASVAPGEGSVRIKVVGKRLMITGDKLDNLITVEKGPDANSYRVTGLAGTQINGHSGSFVFKNVTRGIDANLKGGDDMLVLDGSASPFTVPGTINVRTGRGDDLVRLQGVTGRGDLGSSSGNDLVQLIDSDFSSLAVKMGNGTSTSLELDGVTVTGRTAVRGGNGADTVRAVDSDLAAVLIQTGLGSDTVRLEGVHATGRVQVGTGGGKDLVAVSDSIFDAGVVLGGGLGHDDLDAGTLGGSITKGNTFAVDPVTRGFETKLS